MAPSAEQARHAENVFHIALRPLSPTRRGRTTILTADAEISRIAGEVQHRQRRTEGKKSRGRPRKNKTGPETRKKLTEKQLRQESQSPQPSTSGFNPRSRQQRSSVRPTYCESDDSSE